jgi:hypothetical protein
MESRTTRAFRAAFASLPTEIQEQARRTYKVFLSDPSHPSLRFKKVDQVENVYSVRIGLGIELLGFSRVQ